MINTYLNIDWEESAHDMIVLRDSMLQPNFNFPHPPPCTQGYVLNIFLDDSRLSCITLIISHNCLEKNYLIDLAYPNTLGYLART